MAEQTVFDGEDECTADSVTCPEKRMKLSPEDEPQNTLTPAIGITPESETVPTESDRGKHIVTTLLPDDWVSVRHISGVILYFHKPTRTCTISRPYILSEKRTVKKHRIPVDTIPCLKEWLFGDNKCPLALEWHRISEKQFGQLVMLEPHRIEEYIKLRWPQGIPDTNTNNDIKMEERKRKLPSKKTEKMTLPVPDNLSKLIDIKVPKCYRIANISGKTSPAIWKVNTLLGAVSLLYEFCDHYLRSELEFISQETEDTNNVPYHCTVIIGGTKYGQGAGTSKKIAKRQAADTTLQLFLPDLSNELSALSKSATINNDYKFLSLLDITDPTAANVLASAGLPSPWHILRECCQRNKGCGYIDEPILTIQLKPVITSSEPSTQSPSDPSPLGLSPLGLSPLGPSPLDSPPSDPSPSDPSPSDPSPSNPSPSEPITANLTNSANISGNTANTANTANTSAVQSWYTLKCGEQFVVSGPCPGRKAGQQLAAQAMLKLIHPHIYKWNSLIQLYAITTNNKPRVIQDRSEANSVNCLSQAENYQLLEQLRIEMRKLSSN